jgi:hypothetical protein
MANYSYLRVRRSGNPTRPGYFGATNFDPKDHSNTIQVIIYMTEVMEGMELPNWTANGVV